MQDDEDLPGPLREEVRGLGAWVREGLLPGQHREDTTQQLSWRPGRPGADREEEEASLREVTSHDIDTDVEGVVFLQSPG